MARTPEEEALEGKILAPALYAPENVKIVLGEGVEVTSPALRGKVKLISAYTPAWWYAVCSRCYKSCETSSLRPDDSMLVRWAYAHRCAT